VVTTKTFNARYRAAGRPEAVFVMERLMDIGARRLGLDRRHPPSQLRAPGGHAVPPGLTYKDGVAVTYDPGDFPAAFERALTLLNYGERAAARRRTPGGTRRIGVGLACYAQGTGLGPYEGATVRVDPSGKVYVYIGVTAQGQGHATTLAQIAAAELGAAWEDVQVNAGDTALFPFGMGTGGSRVAANSGPAVAQTAREVRERATRVAAEMLECAPEDVRIEQSRVHVVGMPHRAVSLGKVAHAAVKSKALKATGEPGLTRAPISIPTPSRGLAPRPRRSRSTWRRARSACSRTRSCTIRGGPSIPRSSKASSGRRRAGHRRRAHGRSRATQAVSSSPAA
jgi:CO/xanthine dehydrogenase Mo-binding subunit